MTKAPLGWYRLIRACLAIGGVVGLFLAETVEGADSLGFSHPRLLRAIMTHPPGLAGAKTYVAFHPSRDEVFVGRAFTHSAVAKTPTGRRGGLKVDPENKLRDYKMTVGAYDAATGELLHRYVLPSRGNGRALGCQEAALSADGELLAVVTPGNTSTLVVFDTSTGREVFRDRGMSHHGVGFAQEPRRIVSVGFVGSNKWAVVVRNTTTWDKVTESKTTANDLNYNGFVRASHDGRYFAAGRSLWDASTLEATYGGRPAPRVTDWRPLFLTPDGSTLFAGGLSKLEVWTPPGSRRVEVGNGSHLAGALGPDGSLTAVASRDSVHLVTFPDFVPIEELSVNKRSVCAIAFSSDGRLLASASDDGSTCIWDMADLKKKPK